MRPAVEKTAEDADKEAIAAAKMSAAAVSHFFTFVPDAEAVRARLAKKRLALVELAAEIKSKVCPRGTARVRVVGVFAHAKPLHVRARRTTTRRCR